MDAGFGDPRRFVRTYLCLFFACPLVVVPDSLLFRTCAIAQAWPLRVGAWRTTKSSCGSRDERRPRGVKADQA